MNTAAAFIILFWIITPIVYCTCLLRLFMLYHSLTLVYIVTNTFYFKFLPISAYVTFDNIGQQYNSTAILTNGRFDIEKYHAYSPLYMSATQTVAYGAAFAAFTALAVHTLCGPSVFCT